MSEKTRFQLEQSDIPKQWYNIMADLPEPLPPPLNPATKEPIPPEALHAIFPENLVEQEVCTERYVEIPEPVRDVYKIWRPTPLFRARRLEKLLDTPAKMYYKYEGGSPAGSHKPNTAVAQAFYNKEAGTKRICTETGAGQWGSSLAMACNYFDMECVVYMVKVSYQQKPYRKIMIQNWGGTIYPSPSEHTEFGKSILEKDPDTTGSLGIAISEALEDTVKNPGSKYALGSVLNHVCMHQTVIGEETIKQMEMAGDEPDTIIGCVGGGSNFAGISFPWLRKKMKGEANYDVIAVEPKACPTMTAGELRYDFGDTAEMTPLLWMYTLGHDFVPPGIHAGGLRYHGMAPLVSHVHNLGLIRAKAYEQTKIFEAAMQFTKTEGIVPAPEPSHAIRAAIDEALKAKEEGKEKTILFHMCGHGLMDMAAYDAYAQGKLYD